MFLEMSLFAEFEEMKIKFQVCAIKKSIRHASSSFWFWCVQGYIVGINKYEWLNLDNFILLVISINLYTKSQWKHNLFLFNDFNNEPLQIITCFIK